MSVDFWLGVGVIAGIYGIFVLACRSMSDSPACSIWDRRAS